MRTIHFTVPVITALLGSTFLVGCDSADPASSDDYATEATPPARFAPDQASEEDNVALWKEYCVGDDMTKRPMPNYDNEEVKEAASKLSKVAGHSYSIYGDILAHHKTRIPTDLEGTVTAEAHQFLGYLCGEFRDRATMVQAKVRWVAGMNYLDNADTGAYDPAGNPWKQMKQDDYKPYLAISSALWAAKQAKLEADGKRYMQVGSLQVDTPVPGTTVCETKYMFAEYIKKGRTFDTLDAFQQGYTTFRDASCTLPEDEDYYYDFRGDSNIKPNSPESNGMIWFARTIARQCDARDSAQVYRQARPESTVSNETCLTYFKYPFTSRWNAARAGLATWVLVDPNAGGLDSNSTFIVIPRSSADEKYLFGDKTPYRAKNAEGDITLLEGFRWEDPAMGIVDLQDGDKEKIHKLLQLAVDRHTAWYNSGYDDQMTYQTYKRDQAYSPFVASSYEMSASDNFTSPGVTVQAVDPTAAEYKHFMFVFKIHKDNWYTPERINAEDTPKPDFDRQWFDETSFGETGLANSEKAWDRMGTSLEEEHEAILYLHNVPKF